MNTEQTERVKIILDCAWRLRRDYCIAHGMCPNVVIINHALLEELKLAYKDYISAIINKDNEEAISIFGIKVMVDNSLCDDEVRVAHVVGMRFKA